MAIPVKLERLSKYVSTSEVVEWFRSPGDDVQEGEALLSVHSDKAEVEIPAPSSGVLLEVAVPAGSEVPAGTVLAWIGQPGEEPRRVRPSAEPAEGVKTDAEMTRSLTESQDKVRAVPAARRLAAKHDISLGDLVGSGPGGAVTASDMERAIALRQTAASQDAVERQRISPVARRIAEVGGLRIDQIEGSGPGGSIVKADVERALDAGSATAPATARFSVERDVRSGVQDSTTLPLDGVRLGMAQRMAASHQEIVQVTTVADVDMTEIVRLRETIPASFTAFVITAAARAVAEFPLINASLEEDAIIVKKHVDVGAAVATDDGLLVPVIRRSEEKTLARIHSELEDLARRARDRSLKSSELSAPTLTVTNSGAFGSLLFTPIIVLPQSATLGMGKVAPTAVVREGQIVIRELMYLCLSYDHRFIDGAIAVRYLQRAKRYLENPITLLWDEAEAKGNANED